MAMPSPARVALLGVILLAVLLYAPTIDDYFAQDDFVFLSVGRSVALDPSSLLRPRGAYFPPAWRTPQVAWWALGWWLGQDSSMIFRAGQILKLVAILLEIFLLAGQLGVGTAGAVFAMWFFLIMPLPAESFIWLAASPLHLVIALAGLSLIIAWLQGKRGTPALAAALLLAWISAWTKEAGIWIFAAIGAASLILPGPRNRKERTIAIALALTGAILYVAFYLLLPYHYPSRHGGFPSIARNYFHLAARGWLEPAAAVRMAAHEEGLPSWAGWALSRVAAAVVLSAALWSLHAIRRRPGAHERLRSLLYTVVVSAAAVLPYSLSHVSSGRYLTDTGVFVAISLGLLCEPLLPSKRVAWALVVTCAIFSGVTLMAVAPIRENWALIGRASRRLGGEIRAGADHVNRYVVVGFPEKGGYLRVWHMPRVIPLFDPSVSAIEVAKRVPDVVPPGTAVIVYTIERMPDRYHTYFSSPAIAPQGAH